MAEAALASSFARLSLSLSLPSSLSSLSGLRIEPGTSSSASLLLLPRHRRPAIAPALRIAATSAVLEEREALEKFVKSVMPGGLAAQKLLATGRRKTAVARVCLVEGTGKIIINYRTAQVSNSFRMPLLLAFSFPLFVIVQFRARCCE
jgi:small subunit ribosomal protein S9